MNPKNYYCPITHLFSNFRPDLKDFSHMDHIKDFITQQLYNLSYLPTFGCRHSLLLFALLPGWYKDFSHTDHNLASIKDFLNQQLYNLSYPPIFGSMHSLLLFALLLGWVMNPNNYYYPITHLFSNFGHDLKDISHMVHNFASIKYFMTQLLYHLSYIPIFGCRHSLFLLIKS